MIYAVRGRSGICDDTEEMARWDRFSTGKSWIQKRSRIDAAKNSTVQRRRTATISLSTIYLLKAVPPSFLASPSAPYPESLE